MIDQTIYLCLGRYGDLCNILPILLDDAQNGKRSAVMVSREFSDLMEGVSYADCIVFDGPMADLEKADVQARTLSKSVINTQLVGPPGVVKNVIVRNGETVYGVATDSFVKDQWVLAGRIKDWRRQLPLIFDRRDAEREALLIERVLPRNSRPCILVSTGGLSSPFEHSALLKEMIRLKFCRYHNIIDISNVRATRFFDMLGIFQHPRIHCLVTTDSGPLHLAYGCANLPVVALVNDTPSYWHGSTWRANHVAHIRYHDFPNLAVDMLNAMAEIGCPFGYFSADLDLTVRKVVHVWSEYSEKRTVGKMGRDDIGKWIECAVTPGALGRDSTTQLKDKNRRPFVKDVIRLATLRSNDEDIICLTKPNTVLPEGLSDTLLALNGPAFAYRSFRSPLEHHPATDMFAFTKQWWREHQNEYPDLVLGRDGHWQNCLRELIKLHNGTELPFTGYSERKPRSAPAKGSSESVKHNHEAADAFMKARGIRSFVPRLEAQVPLSIINRSDLYPFGYNPTIIDWNGQRLMIYRWHKLLDLPTALAIAVLDSNNHVIQNSQLTFPGLPRKISLEDAKLFTYRGSLMCSFVQSTISDTSLKSAVNYGQMSCEGGKWSIQNIRRLPLPTNDGNGNEKNWVFFEREGKLYFIYHNIPGQTIYPVAEDTIGEPLISPTPDWPWGRIHGGTPPVPYAGKLLRFFHSRMDNELVSGPFVHRYYIGSCLMEPEPPFGICAVSSTPILKGCEADDLTENELKKCFHHKPRVVFPGSCIQDGDAFLLAFGINDSSCAIARLTTSDLKL